MSPIFDFFLDPYRERSGFFILLEVFVFVFGIASVVLAKRESILVYPTGLIATVITMYLFFKDRLLGDMMINLYYSLMSIYGWWNWSRQKEGAAVVHISRTDKTEKGIGFLLFLAASGLNYLIYKVFDVPIGPSNYVDILTSGIFFTAMWYMATKKLENWTLWILADLITVPLYAYRGWGMLSLQYFIFTILAIQGYREWKKRLNKSLQTS
ncbi:nicotinamide riboside transporter PnuC [Robiginitalea sp.]|uniref:nicotinamide riboside transporter PnuC n=2 Tax=Robiginitalea sp. TaxID=1902411 RepID=UPI003C784533